MAFVTSGSECPRPWAVLVTMAIGEVWGQILIIFITVRELRNINPQVLILLILGKRGTHTITSTCWWINYFLNLLGP
jgi:hypothetical protein